MKISIRLFSLLLALLLHLGLFAIYFPAPRYIPVDTPSVEVTLLKILPRPIEPIAPTAAPKPALLKSPKQIALPSHSAIAQQPSLNTPQSVPQPQIHSSTETVIGDLDSALSSPASAVATLPKFDIKTIPNLAPPPKEHRTVLAKELDKAVRGDCKNAYSQMGLLAIPMLLHDTVSDKGCQW
ncbi:hypothetical protein R6242_03205 [Iodobacter sp. CM08]|uniref:hypothetical protein n=1 Tax=Iodobacter sp. CM08 TaxID=3085902 RepID=UPI00298103B6|nr:hypothetical protein [Iodobacter sp. CM08]MDW5415579.1 hypothetical protein [Iodobacter sp. CM08]